MNNPAGFPRFSCGKRSWSAAAFLAMIIWGMFGLEADGTPGKPFLPEGCAHAELDGLRIRGKEIHAAI